MKQIKGQGNRVATRLGGRSGCGSSVIHSSIVFLTSAEEYDSRAIYEDPHVHVSPDSAFLAREAAGGGHCVRCELRSRADIGSVQRDGGSKRQDRLLAHWLRATCHIEFAFGSVKRKDNTL